MRFEGGFFILIVRFCFCEREKFLSVIEEMWEGRLAPEVKERFFKAQVLLQEGEENCPPRLKSALKEEGECEPSAGQTRSLD